MAEKTFTYLGKTYSLPDRFAQRDIPTLKKFLKSFNEWKTKGGTLESYLKLSGRGAKFDKQEGTIWRRLIDFAESGGKTARRAPSDTGGAKYVQVFNELKFPKKDIDTLKTFTTVNRRTAQAAINATPAAAIKNIGDPVMGEIIEWTNKNKGATEEEFFRAFRKIGSNGDIIRKVVTAYQGAVRNLTKIARGDVIGETQEKLYKAFKPNQLDVFSKEAYRLFPGQLRRGFETTLREVYKDNPRILKSALNKYKEYRELISSLTKEFNLSPKGGMKGLGKGAFQLDHPISFSVLEKTGNLADAIRVNPVTGDVNQFKLMFDKRLVTLRNNIAAGKEGSKSAFEALQRANKRLFGKLAADFDIKDTGKIKVKDYGAAKFTDKTFDPRVALKENLNLSNVLRETKFDKGVYKDLKEAGVNIKRFDTERAKLNRVDVEKMALFIDDALANAKANGPICSIVGKKQSGGPVVSCVDAVNDALEKDPKKLAQEINRSNEGGAFNKIKNSGTKFLTALKENPNLLRGGLAGKIALGLGTVAAGVGAGALVKQFRNDDPSTYLTNDSQMEGMIIADVEQKGKEVDDNILLDNQFKLEAAAAAGLTAPIAKDVYRTARGVGEAGPLPEGVGRTRAALGLNKGVLGKGLWALGTPAVQLPSTLGYIAKDVREGKDASEIALNPLNYLGPAFAGLSTQALAKAGASRALLGIASLGLGVAGAKVLGVGAALAGLGTLGYQGYKAFTGQNRSDADFFR